MVQPRTRPGGHDLHRLGANRDAGRPIVEGEAGRDLLQVPADTVAVDLPAPHTGGSVLVGARHTHQTPSRHVGYEERSRLRA